MLPDQPEADGEEGMPPSQPRADGEHPRSGGRRAGVRPRLVGREAWRTKLLDALGRPGLVTLCGPAGVGKTTLSRVVLDDFVGDDGGAAWFVDLTEARDASGVVGLVARELGVPADPRLRQRTDERIGSVLANAGACLVVLDNFEQVRAVAEPTVGRWRAAAPAARFLATSRETIGIVGERTLWLPPLELPKPGQAPSESPAVCLLLERIAMLVPWAPSETDLTILGRIAEDLDGLPLALELAAPRVAFLGPEGTEEGLRDRFVFLDAAPARPSRSLGAALEWSWDLLDAEERRGLVACSTFRGSFGLASASDVIGAEHAPNLVQSLCQKSLLHVTGPGRYQMLESVRLFAAQKAKQRETAALERRHARSFLAAAEGKSEAAARGDLEARRWLEREYDNLRVIVDRDVSARAVATAALVLREGMSSTIPLEEQAVVLDAAWRVRGALPKRSRLTLRMHRAVLARRSRDRDHARRELEAVVVATQSGGLRLLHARALLELGRLHATQAAFEAADAALREAARRFEAAAASRWRIQSLCALVPVLTYSGRLAEAVAVAEQLLALSERRVDEPMARSYAEAYAANAFVEAGRVNEAIELIASSAERFRSIGDRMGASYDDGLHAFLRHRQGDLGRAEALYRGAAASFDEMGDVTLAAATRGHLGMLLREQGRFEEARAMLAPAVATLCEHSVGSGLFLTAVLAGVELRLGRRGRARRLLESVREDAAELPIAAEVVRLQQSQLDHVEPFVPAAESIDAILSADGAGGPDSPTSSEVLIVRRIIAAELAGNAATDGGAAWSSAKPALWIASDGGAWREADGQRQDLSQRPLLCRLLRSLRDAHVAEPGRGLTSDELVGRLWPDERLRYSAALNRLRVAVSDLRKAGLRDVVVTRRGRYMLVPELSLVEGDRLRTPP